MIKQAFGALGSSLLSLWDNLLVLTLVNVFWAFSLVPSLAVLSFLPGLAGILVAALLGALLTGPATLALFYMTTEVTRQERLELGEFGRGLRRYYKRGWVVGGLNAIFGVLAVFNLAFYSSPAFADSFFSIGIILWGYVAFLWFALQIYLWPLALRLEKLTLGSLLRNSFLATFKYAIVTLILSLIFGVLLALSFLLNFLPVIIIGTAWYSIVCNKAVSLVLEREAARAATSGGSDSPYRVNVPPPASKDEEGEPGVYTTRNAPPGVKKRGLPDKNK